ncbi:MAG: replication initiator protein A [Lachnospiraceae bacterium]|nr:replication initiator protein A [Lachnospiraceae bacterium]
MGSAMEFDYYYGIEAEQFSFYRVPRLLIKDERFKGLSSDAKLLYGLMLDRMAMSMKNGWLDDRNRAYIIYTVENIREDLGCSKEKAVKILAELDSNKGIGLVERIRRGLGKPDIIYVKNFAVSDKMEMEPSNADFSAEVGETDFKRSEKPTSGSQENRLQEVGENDFKRSEKPTSGGQENRLQEVGKTDLNYNNNNYNDMSYNNHINQSEGIDAIDAADNTGAYMAVIRENLEYDHHMKYDSHNDREMFEEIYEIVCDIVCVKRSKININGDDYPYELVKSRFLKLDSSHVEYVMDCMRNTTTKITNIRSYLIKVLYNAPSTMRHYYQQEVQHDMYGGGWEEKGAGQRTSGHTDQM